MAPSTRTGLSCLLDISGSRGKLVDMVHRLPVRTMVVLKLGRAPVRPRGRTGTWDASHAVPSTGPHRRGMNLQAEISERRRRHWVPPTRTRNGAKPLWPRWSPRRPVHAGRRRVRGRWRRRVRHRHGRRRWRRRWRRTRSAGCTRTPSCPDQELLHRGDDQAVADKSDRHRPGDGVAGRGGQTGWGTTTLPRLDPWNVKARSGRG